MHAIDRKSTVWTKWETDREEIAKAAAWFWIPTDDLLGFLNGLPGAPLIRTDVEQRRAFQEEPYTNCPDDALKEGCQRSTVRRRSRAPRCAPLSGRCKNIWSARETGFGKSGRTAIADGETRSG